MQVLVIICLLQANRYSLLQQYIRWLLQRNIPKAENNEAKASRGKYFDINIRLLISNGLGLQMYL